MSYLHSMICQTEGIRALVPEKWRGFDGSLSVFWDAEADLGARGYYLSPDPRVVIFFNDVSEKIRISNRNKQFASDGRPMTKAIYVPAGIPLWTSFTGTHRFSHLDLHVHQDKLIKLLSPSVGRSVALSALKRPVELQDVGAVGTIAGLLVEEIANPSKHPVYAESLVGSLVAGLLDLPDTPDGPRGRLTQAQMNKLGAFMAERPDCRATVADMASVVGLSESWFATAFKQTTGKTPLQWQLGKRVDLARTLLLNSPLSLADIAAQLGFSDQAHLTKVFRQTVGQTPAAWRRTQLAG